MSQAIGYKFSRIFAGSQIDIRPVVSKIINGVRNDDPIGEVREVMVVNPEDLFHIQAPISIQITQKLLFLGIDADDRQASREKLFSEGRNVLELFVPEEAGSQTQAFTGLPLLEFVLLEQLFDSICTDGAPWLRQCICNLVQCEIRPTNVLIHGTPGRVFGQDLLKLRV